MRSETPRVNGSVPPLVVDMDGTLIYSDSLLEGCMQLWRREPFKMVMLPVWLLKGRAGFKAEIANRVTLDARHLPYNLPLIEYLTAAREERQVILCTAADYRFARSIADHLALFDDVIATTEGVNLKSKQKAQALVDRFGKGGFDYAGNDIADIPVFADARKAIAVNPTTGLKRRLSSIPNSEDGPSGNAESVAKAQWRALRPHQWVKNLLVFVPLLAVFSGDRLAQVVPASLAFVAFCMIASSVYLLNDMLDLSTDRQHPRKKYRPFAAGSMPIQNGMVLIPLLMLGGFGIAFSLGWMFAAVMMGYSALTAMYSVWLKRIPLLDTLVLAGLYTMRILAGAAAISVVPSVWLLSFSMFLFLSLALAKRHSELMEMQSSLNTSSIPGREYRAGDLMVLISQGSASGYSAVLVLALYINSEAVREHYRHPEVIWLICPLVLYWINKLWLNSQRREIYDEPIVWAMRNRVSRGIALFSVALLLLARFLP